MVASYFEQAAKNLYAALALVGQANTEIAEAISINGTMPSGVQDSHVSDWYPESTSGSTLNLIALANTAINNALSGTYGVLNAYDGSGE